MKKILSAFCFGVALMLVGCEQVSNTHDSNQIVGVGLGNNNINDNDEKTMVIEAVSAIETISSNVIEIEATSSKTNIPTESSTIIESEVIESTNNEEVSQIDPTKYIELLENSQMMLDSKIIIESVELDDVNYQAKNIVKYQGNEYIMYISETEEKNDIDDDETETKIKYKGIIIFNDKTYTYKAKKTSEIESDESEEEIEFKIYLDNGKTLKIKQEVEIEGNKLEEAFSYVLKDNNGEKEVMKIEREIKTKGTEIKVKTNNYNIKFKITVVDEITYIKVKPDKKTEITLKRIESKDDLGNVLYSYELA